MLKKTTRFIASPYTFGSDGKARTWSIWDVIANRWAPAPVYPNKAEAERDAESYTEKGK